MYMMSQAATTLSELKAVTGGENIVNQLRYFGAYIPEFAKAKELTKPYR